MFRNYDERVGYEEQGSEAASGWEETGEEWGKEVVEGAWDQGPRVFGVNTSMLRRVQTEAHKDKGEYTR